MPTYMREGQRQHRGEKTHAEGKKQTQAKQKLRNEWLIEEEIGACGYHSMDEHNYASCKMEFIEHTDVMHVMV